MVSSTTEFSLPLMKLRIGLLASALAVFSVSTPAQNSQAQGSTLTADYPNDRVGMLVQDSGWNEIPSAMPAKTKAKHGIAASLSYGAVPATVVAEYEGPHAQTQVHDAQPIICICHILSIPGDPVIVRLHLKKTTRELDGGKMVVYPIVGGNKMADANKSDLVPVEISHPDPHVWLIRPQSVLPEGEYALMLGTQNVNVFPFGVAASDTPPAQKK